ncbi:MAG: alanine--tRNA ligase/DNA-binding transcriptional repressor [Candidatus Westeberhardia cardiocondylae]|nr:alanine--tRNA ligase/DNA-binding transcriptional repressor [Candidatus Westeberhardia cardiocondylae]
MKKNISEIRQMFFDFFEKKNHKIITGSSLIPENDTSLLFTNAGMNQFKDIFLEKIIPTNKRVVTSQYCIRAGGKHNDLENVGYTTQHHTFFEMLGNFSFGDYFKNEAIQFAWELLTSKKWFNLSKDKLFVTIHEQDYETYNIWKNKIGIPDKHIFLTKNKKYNSENFWKMGDTGPCGPCTEIFYNNHKNIKNNNLTTITNINKNQYIEIWNLVFIQFNQKNNKTLIPLSTPFVDTGMGLERITSIIQKVYSNYDIDIFRKLIFSISQILKINNLNHKSLYVLADHIRSCSFLINYGITPSSEGRGYVLRRIIRRAIRHGYALGVKDIFFYKLLKPLISIMNDTNNQLKKKQLKIEKILRTEEKQFIYILKRGIHILKKKLKNTKKNTITGKVAFNLYDTYGFPIDLTIEICKEHKTKVDIEELKKIMKKKCKNTRKKNLTHFKNIESQINQKPTKFLGYKKKECQGKIITLLKNNQETKIIYEKEEATVILDKTSFYGESGGQIGDSGILQSNNGTIFEVFNTKKYKNGIFAHIGILKNGKLILGEKLNAKINVKKRNLIQSNHSSTHLLYATLKKVLDKNIQKKGSFINEKYLHFDFTYSKSINNKQIYQIENIINKHIKKNIPIITKIITLNENNINKKNTIKSLYDKYGKKIRILIIKNISTEFCCGTHANKTGDIKIFHIISEYSIASGVRRIKAITGETAIKSFYEKRKLIDNINEIINNNDEKIILNKIQKLQNFYYKYKKEIQKSQLKKYLQTNILSNNNIKKINGIRILSKNINNIDTKKLRIIAKNLKNKEKNMIIILTTKKKEKIIIIVCVTNDLINQIQANTIIYKIIQKIDGKGGGKKDFAEGGGNNIISLQDILSELKILISNIIIK